MPEHGMPFFMLPAGGGKKNSIFMGGKMAHPSVHLRGLPERRPVQPLSHEYKEPLLIRSGS